MTTVAAVRASSPTRSMLKGPVLPTLLRLATPNVIGLFSITVVISYDGYIVGRLGSDALAGVALVLPLAMLMLQMAAGGFGGTATAAVSRALGAGKKAQATALAQHALMLGAAASLLFTAIATRPMLYAGMGGSGAALGHAVAYANVLFAGAAAIWLMNVLAGIARGTGDMVAGSVALIGTTVMHLFLCPALVFGAGPFPALGVAGAAASTVVSNAVGAAALLAWLSQRSGQVQIIGQPWRAQADIFGRLLKVAVPSSVNSLLSNGCIAVGTAYMASFGSVAVAAYGIAARLEYILVPIAFGIGGALTAMVAANLGADQATRAKRIAWVGAAVVLAMTGFIGLAAAIAPELWMNMFTTDAAVQAAGHSYLHIVGGTYGLYGVGLALFFASQGAGHLMWPLAAGTTRLVVVAVGGWLVASVPGARAEMLYAVIGLGLTTLGLTLAAATYFARWKSRA